MSLDWSKRSRCCANWFPKGHLDACVPPSRGVVCVCVCARARVLVCVRACEWASERRVDRVNHLEEVLDDRHEQHVRARVRVRV